ncbi:lipopolysaccharide biosynthesis protein [Pontibacter beigongshangensis]|uniref:lipopolysaccharide biosynthesis protein n=1 Tax=Pontibacter beigongshangensis TaxID=2574733 RepID=UPI00164FB1BA|nr:lipopolysaccharide biosynthesis protein [Pontibacter beigongshangensis]
MNIETVREESRDEKWFQTDHIKADLKGRSVRGGISTMAAQVLTFIMTTAQTVVLARLLVPEDFGLIAMVSSVTGFVTIFKDLGLSSAIIQKEKLTQQEVSSVFWLNVLICLGIALGIALLSPAIAYFYDEDRLLPITLIFALNIFIVGFSIQHGALMRRQMRFKRLSLIQLSAVSINILAGILMAWLGFGYWTLVLQGFIFTVLETIALWTSCDWRPSFSFKILNVKPFVKFGAGISGFDLVNHFSRNMDDIFVGKFVGSVALGLYSKAYQLLMLPITQLRNPLNSVALPALSSLQNDEFRYRGFYTRYLFILAFFSMPTVVYLGVFADELILIVLGEQWSEAGLLFQLLAIAAFIQPVLSTTGLILITTGKVNRYFKIGLINAICMVSGFGIGVWLDGVKGVAIANSVVVYALFIPTLWFNLYKSPVSVVQFLREILQPLGFALISGAVMLFYIHYMSNLNMQLPAIAFCALGFFVGAFTYIGLMAAFSASREKLMQIINIRTFFK